ncbi:hypothetical protein KXW02_007919, partial [Aspergillus fumigatus]
ARVQQASRGPQAGSAWLPTGRSSDGRHRPDNRAAPLPRVRQSEHDAVEARRGLPPSPHVGSRRRDAWRSELEVAQPHGEQVRVGGESQASRKGTYAGPRHYQGSGLLQRYGQRSDACALRQRPCLRRHQGSLHRRRADHHKPHRRDVLRPTRRRDRQDPLLGLP